METQAESAVAIRDVGDAGHDGFSFSHATLANSRQSLRHEPADRMNSVRTTPLAR